MQRYYFFSVFYSFRRNLPVLTIRHRNHWKSIWTFFKPTFPQNHSRHPPSLKMPSFPFYPKPVIMPSRPPAKTIHEQNETCKMENTDNNRFILFSVLMTDMDTVSLTSLLSPQFSHRSPIVLPPEKENWGRTEVEGWKKKRTMDSAKEHWLVKMGECKDKSQISKGWPSSLAATRSSPR